MAQITIYFRAYGWRSNGVRWQGPACPQTYTTDSERWYRLNLSERDRVLERATMMEFPEVDRIDHIAIESIK